MLRCVTRPLRQRQYIPAGTVMDFSGGRYKAQSAAHMAVHRREGAKDVAEADSLAHVWVMSDHGVHSLAQSPPTEEEGRRRFLSQRDGRAAAGLGERPTDAPVAKQRWADGHEERERIKAERRAEMQERLQRIAAEHGANSKLSPAESAEARRVAEEKEMQKLAERYSHDSFGQSPRIVVPPPRVRPGEENDAIIRALEREFQQRNRYALARPQLGPLWVFILSASAVCFWLMARYSK